MATSHPHDRFRALAPWVLGCIRQAVIALAWGIGLSVVGSGLLDRWLHWSIAIPPEALAIAVAFATSVGVVFGFYPAWRAARLDPIEALRSE